MNWQNIKNATFEFISNFTDCTLYVNNFNNLNIEMKIKLNKSSKKKEKKEKLIENLYG